MKFIRTVMQGFRRAMLLPVFRSIEHPWMLCAHCTMVCLSTHRPIDRDARALLSLQHLKI